MPQPRHSDAQAEALLQMSSTKTSKHSEFCCRDHAGHENEPLSRCSGSNPNRGRGLTKFKIAENAALVFLALGQQFQGAHGGSLNAASFSCRGSQ
eukprot:4080748-Amphidinium_carterae.1